MFLFGRNPARVGPIYLYNVFIYFFLDNNHSGWTTVYRVLKDLRQIETQHKQGGEPFLHTNKVPTNDETWVKG